jgi:3-methyladenine DNA glycosylase AlkC
MKSFSESNLATVIEIISDFKLGKTSTGIAKLRCLKDEIYASIPEKQRIGRGITWVVQQISQMIAQEALDDAQIFAIAEALHQNLEKDDRLLGVPIFLMAEVGSRNLEQALPFFTRAALSEDWVVREFAQGAFLQVISAQRENLLPWLQESACSPTPLLRRFVAESLRPVANNRWINQQPEFSLSVLRLLFREVDPYPRTSVGNNLSDLSRRHPELIFAIVQELVASGDPDSYWIAYRACRNLVKQDPQRVMDLLGVQEYHYKDRNFYHSSEVETL